MKVRLMALLFALSLAFGLPLLAVDGMPQGVQIMGFRGGDDRSAAHARWICDALLAG